MCWFAGALALCTAARSEDDPWTAADLMQPATLADRLQKGGPQPIILYVGFPFLYRATHISGARLAGPATKPAGLDALRAELAKIPRDKEVIIYCGCCPWDHCPNIRPAFQLLREMGFRHARLLVLPTNMHTDWVAKGYPVEHSSE